MNISLDGESASLGSAIRKHVDPVTRLSKVLFGGSKNVAMEILNSMDDAVIVYDTEGRIIFVSRRMLELTGFSEKELIGQQPPFCYWPESERDTLMTVFAESLRNASGLIETDFLTRGGKQFPVLINPSLLRYGGQVVGLVSVVRTRIAYLKAKEESDFFRMVIDTMLIEQDLAYWNWSLDGQQPDTLSDSYFTMLGYEPQAWKPSYEAWTKHVHPNDIGDADKGMESLLNGSAETYTAEFRMRDAQGKWRWILSRGYVTRRDEKGNPQQITGIHQDIHHHKLQEQQAILSQKIDALGHITGGIAHDFNNLLTILYGNVDMLQRCSEDKRAHYMERIKHTLTRASGLTNSLLNYARNKPSRSEVLSVNRYLASLEDVFRAALKSGIRLDFDFAGEEVRIELDEGALENAILNLIINARDAILSKAEQSDEAENREYRITVSTRVIPARFLASELPGLDSELYVSVTVQDNGSGMDEETLAKATEPMFTTKPAGQGTGLGLNIINRVIKDARGLLDIKSEPGRGTEVSMFFPVLPVSAIADDSLDQAPPTELSGSGQKILIIDDEAGLLDVLTEHLENLSYEVLKAANPRQALSLIESEAPDLVLTDIVMPFTLNGVDLAQRARELKPDLKLVFMTGYASLEDNKIAAKMGPVLQKPFSIHALAQSVREQFA